MEDQPIKIEMRLSAIWMIVNAKNEFSSYENYRALDVTQKTAMVSAFTESGSRCSKEPLRKVERSRTEK